MNTTVMNLSDDLQGRPQHFLQGGCNLWLIAPTFLLQYMHDTEKNGACNKIVNAILSEINCEKLEFYNIVYGRSEITHRKQQISFYCETL